MVLKAYGASQALALSLSKKIECMVNHEEFEAAGSGGRTDVSRPYSSQASRCSSGDVKILSPCHFWVIDQSRERASECLDNAPNAPHIADTVLTRTLHTTSRRTFGEVAGTFRTEGVAHRDTLARYIFESSLPSISLNRSSIPLKRR